MIANVIINMDEVNETEEEKRDNKKKRSRVSASVRKERGEK